MIYPVIVQTNYLFYVKRPRTQFTRQHQKRFLMSMWPRIDHNWGYISYIQQKFYQISTNVSM